MALSPLFQEALDAILTSINRTTGLSHPDDLSKTVDLFRQLLDAGEFANQDEIVHYLIARKTPSGADMIGQNEALEIQRVWEVLIRARGPLGGTWRTNIMEILRERANQRP